ncbi:trinucleotide repeat-containing 18 protein isoform C [Alligator mississippiensis]|uniref:Trinucleotide repeat-containing 18 protein isoform C n=1 Tax=Alligator mississippiensis TaxID=8496 RepID=A0A151N279_ALLMI|nr:trinucleotide repeat-containing 18 protein isoform C [Alligator mississippiensis]
MEGHRVGAASAAGRLGPSAGPLAAGLPAPLQPGKYLASGISLHSHPGFSHLPNGLYPSYIPLNHLEPPSSGSPLLAQLGQHSLFESQKDGFYLSGHAGQPALQPQAPISRTAANHTPSALLREKDLGHLHKSSKESMKDPPGKERACRSDLSLPFSKKDSKQKEEPRPRSVVDLTQDTKPDSERKVAGLVKAGERLSPFLMEHMPNRGAGNGEPKSKNPLQTSSLSNCNGGGDPMLKVLGVEQDRCAKDPSRHDENMRPSAHAHPDRLKRGDSILTSVGALHVSCSCPSPHAAPPGKMAPSSTFPPQPVHSNMYTIFPPAKEPGREHKVIAPTFVPSVEAYDERNGPIQIASQARDNKAKDKDMGKVGVLQSPTERCLADTTRTLLSQDFSCHSDTKRMEALREKGSVIRANSMALKRQVASEPFLNRPGLGSPESREFLAAKDLMKPSPDVEHRACDRDRFPRAGSKESAKVYGTLDSSRQHLDHGQLKPPEQKWKPFEMGNFATTQMAVLAAQHNHVNRVEEEAKKVYLDPSGLQRSSVVGSRGSADILHPTSHGEGSAMQSLIKYSGSFAKENAARQSCGKKSPFGGLGNMKPDSSQLGASKGQQLLSQPMGKQLKRDPERPESAKSFGRESIGSQGEVEVRHLPVGIAVAVARQKDNSSSKLGPSLADRDRSLSLSSIKGHGRSDDDCGDDRGRHRDSHLLAGRLERDQEKLLRESKELADFARIHPSGCATNGLNSNLMVTGGPTLASSGRWSADPASHLAAHPWLPRTGSPSMWLAGHPYGLGHPSLHQGMTPGFPPAMGGALPSAYQFVRDPQSGQLVVIPSEHLPHFAELMERTPPLWPAMYPPTRSSLQHAHQLQLLSHQQLLRQHELYILQQQAAHAMELQRSAQLVERLKANEHRVDMEEKISKRSLDNAKSGLSSSTSGLLHRKPPILSPSTSTSYSKAVSPPPLSPRASPVSVLKAEVIQKMEAPPTQPAYSYPATPSSHPSSPPPASPPPAPTIPPKEETPENVEKKDLELEKEATSPFQALFPEIPPGYPFQSLPASFGRHYPYLLQPTAASDADGLAPDVPLPAEGSEHMELSPEVKPIHLSPSKMLEPIQATVEEEVLEERVKSEVEMDESQEGICEQDMEALNMATSTAVPVQNMDSCNLLLRQGEALSAMEQEQEVLQSCQQAYQVVACPAEAEAQAEAGSGPETCSVHMEYESSLMHTESEQPEIDVKPEGEEPSLAMDLQGSHLPQGREFSSLPSAEGEQGSEIPPYADEAMSCQIPALDIKPDDPLAGMNALVAATEMPQACSLLTTSVITHSQMTTEASPDQSLEHSFLQGITLLSEIAEMELEKRKQEMQNPENCPIRPTLESLLAASTHMLMEVLSTPFMDSLKTIRLPRELNPNKKYSWMQKKDEPMFSIKSAIENMDAMELDYRMRLAEVQRRYKEKQRELVKLQRRRDSEEKHDEKSRSLARRGPGRPRKRKHGSSGLSPLKERGKSDSKSGKLSKSLLLSEDSETGEGMKKRHKGALPEEDEDAESGGGKVKGRNQSWEEHEAVSSFSNELKIKKKKVASDQEQLANKLDKALSLTKQDKLKSPFKFADSSGGKQKTGGGSVSRYLSPHEPLLSKEEKKSMAKSLSLSLKTSKEGKNKMAAKMKKMEVGLKVKSQLKVSHSPAISEVSSYSYNTDSEEDDESLKDEWPSQSPSSSKMRPPNLYSVVAKKSSKPAGGLKPAKRGMAATRTLKSKPAASRKQQFCLLLREAEAGSSFSDSSEDSFDQDSSSEEEEEEDEEEEEEAEDYGLDGNNRLSSPALDESGLGLLARFAASAMPSPIVPPPLSIVQLEAKQKAKKKEERQSLMGTEFEYTDSESEIKIRKKSPSGLLRGKKGLMDQGSAAPSQTASILDPSSGSSDKVKVGVEKGRKLKKFKSPKDLSFEFGLEVSDDDLWNRRRSERIFLHDASASSSVLTPATPASSTPASKPARCGKGAPLSPKKDGSKGKERKELNKRKKGKDGPCCSSSSSMSPPGIPSSPSDVRVSLANSLSSNKKSKAKVKAKEVKKENRGKGGAVSKLMESMAAEEDFEPNQDSSFSEDENLPLSMLVERPPTPAPRSCIIDKDELKDGLRVLIPMDDKLLYAGHVKTVHSPDIYRVVVEGERGNRPHIYCLEQLLQEAIIDVKPPSVRFLPEGTRIAAYWSQQYRCLYPGTVVRGALDLEEDGDLITVEFDDGDTGRIPLSHIRLLPPDYKIQCAEPSPALLVPSTKRRSRKSSKDAGEGKESAALGSEEPAAKGKGRGRKPNAKPKADVAALPEEASLTESASGAASAPEKTICLSKQTAKGARKSQQLPVGGSPVPSEEKRNKGSKMKISAKLHSPAQPSFQPPVFGGVISPEPYSELPGPLGTFSPADTPSGKAKGKKGRSAEEGQEFSSTAKAQRKQPDSEILIKLDHEGVMSPKTKKMKEAMRMLEDSGLASRRDGKGVLSLGYPSAMSGDAKQKSSRTKVAEGEPSAGNFGGSGESLAASKDQEDKASPTGAREESESNSSDSSSESEGQKQPPPPPQQQQQKQQQKQQQGGNKSRPKKREGIHLPTTKELAKRQRLPSVENRPKIAAFLPARQLWKWFGKPTQRRGMKGKARKLFYKAIVRGKEIIRIGDCAVFLSAGRPNLPYIGRIQSMWESWGNNMVVRVKWFYHPEETNPGKKLNEGKRWDQKSGRSLSTALQASNQRKDFMERALYQSSHVDENDVQTISHKCLVVGLDQYEQMLKTKKYQDSEDLYYLAGTYEPTTGMIFNTDGVPVIC